MRDKFFVDTNILIYAHDRSGGIKHELARNLIEELWESGAGVLSAQVLQEACVNLRKRVARPLPGEEVRSLVQHYLAWEVVVSSGESVVRALEIETRYHVSFWDALIIQAAEESGAEVLYSEDLNDQQKYGAVRVVNPLVSGRSEA